MKPSLLLSAALAATLTAHAETWSYSDCVEHARSHNISLQKSRLAEQSSAYDLDEAEAQWQPTLDFATTHSLSNHPWAEGNKNAYTSTYGLNAGWTVWDGGRRENTIKRNRLQTEIDRLNTDHTMRTLETDLLQVYFNILYARESTGIYEEAARLSGAQAERARHLMEAGRISKVDYAQLRSQHEQDLYAAVNARGVYDTRRMELKKLLELGIDSDIEPAAAEWTDDDVLAQLPPITESYKLALATDLRIRSLGKEEKGSDLDVAIANAGRMPQISLNAGIGTGYNAPGTSFGNGMKYSFGESVGLTLSVPIFDNKKTASAVARAKIRQLEARLDIDQRQTELSQLVENWYIDTRSAQAKFTAARQQLESALVSSELTDEQFRLGLVNPVELMTAHNDLTEARHTLLQSKFMAILGRKMIEFYRSATVTMP